MLEISGYLQKVRIGDTTPGAPEQAPAFIVSEANRQALALYDWPVTLQFALENRKSFPAIVAANGINCPNCGGAGQMYVFVYSSGPHKYPNGSKQKWFEGPGIAPGWYTGALEYAPCPVCQEDNRQEWLWEHCGLAGEDLKKRLSNFRTEAPFTDKEAGLDAMRQYLGMNEFAHGFCTLWGSVGRGKSHLLKGLVNGMVAIGVHARYLNSGDLLKEISSRFSDDNGNIRVEQAIAYYRRIKVLAIDEFDKTYLTPWAESTLHRLLDTRYNESDHLLTALAMNPDPETLPGSLDYLRSRIRGGLVIEVGGPDIRYIYGMNQRRVFEQERQRQAATGE